MDIDEGQNYFSFDVGEELTITGTSVKAGKTSIPKSYTEDTLLNAMEKAGSDETPDEAERKGLGTPATRAGIIEKLVRTGFIERRGDKKTKYLAPTIKGEMLISVIPEAIQSASISLRLSMILNGFLILSAMRKKPKSRHGKNRKKKKRYFDHQGHFTVIGSGGMPLLFHFL